MNRCKLTDAGTVLAAVLMLVMALAPTAAQACASSTDALDLVTRQADHRARRAAVPINHPSPSRPDGGNLSWSQPCFGFNTRGLLDVDEQVAYVRDYLAQVTPWIRPSLVIRVTGGTASQKSYASDWSDPVIAQWAALQQDLHIHLIYVVNGNDTPANQRAIIQRWLDAGARFDFLEMMNEYYLPKYRHGDTSRPEVSTAVTPEIYANDILPAFWAELDRFHLPYYIIFAPSRPDRPNADATMQHWNDVMINAVIDRHPDRDINTALHLYSFGADGISSFDYQQIDRLRARLPAGRHIAITEAGVLDPSLSSAQAGELATDLYRTIAHHLTSGDYLFDHALYSPSLANTADLSPQYDGQTPKGTQVLQFINSQLR